MAHTGPGADGILQHVAAAAVAVVLPLAGLRVPPWRQAKLQHCEDQVRPAARHCGALLAPGGGIPWHSVCIAARRQSQVSFKLR